MNTKIMPAKERYRELIESNPRTFYCMDDEEKSIYGTSNSLKQRSIRINLERCSDRPDCAHRSLIDKVLDKNAIILL